MYKRDKWEKVRNLITADISHAVHYSCDKLYEHNVAIRYLQYMESLDTEENWHKEYIRYMEKGLE